MRREYVRFNTLTRKQYNSCILAYNNNAGFNLCRVKMASNQSRPLNVFDNQQEQIGSSSLQLECDGNSLKAAQLADRYTTNNPVGFSLADNAKPIVIQAAESIQVDGDRPVILVDIGAADGGASFPAIEEAIITLKKKHGEEQSVLVVYEDLIMTNFTSLFLRLQGIDPPNETCLTKYKNVFPLANACNMYARSMPRSSVDLMYTAMAVHYLSEIPCNLSDSLTAVTCKTPRELDLFAKRAESDWNSFLVERAKELRPGGHLVVVGHEGKRCYSFYLLMDTVWREFYSASKITKEEYQKATFTFYHRSLEEYRNPFRSKTSEVIKAGLELVEFYTRDVPKPDYEVKLDKGDGINKNIDGESSGQKSERVLRTARGYLLDARRWTEDTLRAGLDPTRPDVEKDTLLDQFYAQLQVTVLKDPIKYGELNSFAFLLIRKN